MGALALLAAAIPGCSWNRALPVPIEEAPVCIRVVDGLVGETEAGLVGLLEESSLSIAGDLGAGDTVWTAWAPLSPAETADRGMEHLAFLPSYGTAAWPKGRFRLAFTLEPSGLGQTEVRAVAHIRAYGGDVLARWHDVVSRGLIEARFLAGLARVLAER